MKRFFRFFSAFIISALMVLSLLSGPGETTPYSFEGLGILPGFSDRYPFLRISANGKVVVGWGYSHSNGGISQAFRWTSEGGMVGLGTFPGGISSRALGVSADGSVVVGWSTSTTGPQACRWTGTDIEGLGYLSKSFSGGSEAHSISADGSVVVGWSTSLTGTQAFRWTKDVGMVGLGYLPNEPHSCAYDVSADGSIVVGYGFSSEYVGEAFIWNSANGMRNLNNVLINEYGLDLTGWTLTLDSGITPDGLTIVGTGIHNGVNEAWIARLNPVPVPSALILFGSGLLGLAGWRGFRKI